MKNFNHMFTNVRFSTTVWLLLLLALISQKLDLKLENAHC